MGKIVSELHRVAFAELLGVGGLLSLEDPLVLLLLGGGLQALPGQRAPQEIHKHEAQGLDIVSSTLFDAQMCVDRRVSRRAGQIFALVEKNEDQPKHNENN